MSVELDLRVLARSVAERLDKLEERADQLELEVLQLQAAERRRLDAENAQAALKAILSVVPHDRLVQLLAEQHDQGEPK
jgi:hypothetical protein